MWKEKVTYLFNKNNITIEKIEKCVSIDMREKTARQECISVGEAKSYKKTKTIIKEVKKESPLGFYYTKKIQETIDETTGKEATDKTWFVITANVGSRTYYRLKFLVKSGDNSVLQNEDSLRPWEVAEGDNSLNNTMLDALVKSLNEFFDILSQHKVTVVDKRYNMELGSWEWIPIKKSLRDIKNDTYSYMYGNKNGLRVMTDEQKIISHGFDLKTSFRKDKEIK